MNCKTWVVPLLLFVWGGLCPASSCCVESSETFHKASMDQVADDQQPLDWETALLDSAEKGAEVISDYPNFTDNPRITKKMRRLMFPYLLPLNSSLKPIVDEIFNHPGIIKNEQTLKKSGFTILFSQKRSFIVVARHPKLKGYLFKIYLDSKKVHKDGMCGWELLTTRCIVAKKIKTIIHKKKLHHFTVATKWLYPVPPSAQKGSKKAEPVVLIVKDMKIFNRSHSRKIWETKANQKILKELYAVLGRGYGSAFLHGNVPYTKKGKFAFIDTEYAKRKIALAHVKHFLSKEMKIYWDRLTSGCSKKRGVYASSREAALLQQESL